MEKPEPSTGNPVYGLPKIEKILKPGFSPVNEVFWTNRVGALVDGI
jgi:hypothetical protein